MAFLHGLLLLIVPLFFGQAIAQYPAVWKADDVVTYYCARWFHQAIVKNNYLYLYGGAQSYKLPSTNVESTDNILGFNPMILKLDLSTSWSWRKNMSWVSSARTQNPRTGAVPRYAMAGGTMFHGPHNDSRVWTYSGTTFRGNDTMLEANYPEIVSKVSDQYPLWSYDSGSQAWDQFDTKQITTPSYGAATEATDQGLAFYLHGKIDNGTAGRKWFDGDVTALMDGMMIIDTARQTAKNISTATLKEKQPRIGGLIQYVPHIGRSGLIVAIGGRVFDGKMALTSSDIGRLLSFDTVDVFDVASYQQKDGGTWYSQGTSGDIPPPRINSCSIITSAPDNSTHNIYIFSGQNPINHTYYDDVYVLSLPTFTWVKLYQSESGRYGHTCHLVGRQMLTTGGHNIRNNITGMCDWELGGVGILDLTSMNWGSNFNASAKEYELDKTLVQVVGGTPQGNAPRRVPEKGWASPAFERLMNVTRVYDNYKGTLQVIDSSPPQPPSGSPPLGTSSTDHSKSNRTAIITGVTIFVVVFLSCAAWLIYLYRRHRSVSSRMSSSSSIAEMDDKAKAELSQEGKKLYEMADPKICHQAPDTSILPELDRENAVMKIAELPATNFGEGGRWGVPIIKVPTPTTSRRGSAVGGLLGLMGRRGSRDSRASLA